MNLASLDGSELWTVTNFGAQNYQYITKVDVRECQINHLTRHCAKRLIAIRPSFLSYSLVVTSMLTFCLGFYKSKLLFNSFSTFVKGTSSMLFKSSLFNCPACLARLLAHFRKNSIWSFIVLESGTVSLIAFNK